MSAANAQKTDAYLPQWLKIDSLFWNHNGATALKDLEKLRLKAKKDNNIGQQVKILLFQIVKDTQNTEGVVTAVKRLEQAEKMAKQPVKAVLQSLLGELFGLYTEQYMNFNKNGKQQTFAKDDIRSLNREQMLDKALAYYEASLQDTLSKQLSINVLDALTEPNRLDEDPLRPTVYDFLAHRVLDFGLKRWRYSEELRYRDADDGLFEALFAPADSFKIYPFDKTEGISATHRLLLRTFQNLLIFHQKDAQKAAFLEVERRRFFIFMTTSFPFPKEKLYETHLENLVKRYETDPSVIGVVDVLAQHYIQKGNRFKPAQYSYQKAEPDNRFFLQKADDLCRRTLAQHQQGFARELLENHIKFLQKRHLLLETEAVVLPEKPILFKVSFRNIDTVYCRWLKVSALDSVVWFFNADDGHKYVKNYQTIVRNQTIALPSIQDFQMHETEVIAEGLPLGHYLLLVSNNPQFDENTEGSFVRINPMTVSALAVAGDSEDMPIETNNLSLIRYYMRQKKHVATVVHRETGVPLAAKIVDLKAERGQNGAILFKNMSKAAQERYEEKRLVILGNDTCYINKKEHNDVEDYRIKVHFFTDRNIYRPSQTIQFKGILIDEKQKGQPRIWKKQKVSVVFSREYDEDEPIDTLTVTTNEFGSFSGSFKAPSGGELGAFQLSAHPIFDDEEKEEDFEDKYNVRDRDATQIIRVEEYKRPRFELVMEPQNRSYRVGDTVRLKGRAMALAGSAVDGIKVNYRAFQRVFKDYARQKQRVYVPLPASESNDDNDLSDTLTTDANGGFMIQFVVKRNEADSALEKEFFLNYRYSIDVNAVDVNGETQSSHAVVLVGSTSVVFDIPIGEYIKRQNTVNVPLSIVNKNKPNEGVLGSIRVEKITKDVHFYQNRYWETPDTFLYDAVYFRQHFPELNYPFAKQATVADDTSLVYVARFNSRLQKSVLLRGLSQWQVGTYRFTMTVFDAFLKDSISKTVNFELLDFDKKELPASDDIKIYTDKTVYHVGDKIKLAASVPYTEGSVFVEWLSRSKVVKSRWLTAQNGVVSMDYTIKEADRGVLSCRVNMVKNNRQFDDNIEIPISQADKQLNIEVGTFRDRLTPNSNETWTLRISNKNNKPVNAEMVATLYDASLDLLKGNGLLDWQKDIYEFPYRRSYDLDWAGFHKEGGVTSSLLYVVKSDIAKPNVPLLFKRQARSFHWFSLEGYTYSNKNVLDYFMGDAETQAAIWQLSGAVYYENGERIKPNFEVLNDSTVLLDGVTITGYGTMMKKNVTGSVLMIRGASSISADELNFRGSRSNGTDYYIDGIRLSGVSAGLSIDNSLSEVVVTGYGALKKVRETDAANLATIKARSNLNETAFFFPHLTTDTDGKVSLTFTMNEALTRWNFLAWAHTQDLKTGYLLKTAVSQKDLMVFPNMPRFLREGDEIELVAKVSNLKKETAILRGQIQLQLFDAKTMQPIDNECITQNSVLDWSANNGQSAVAKWRIKVPSAAKYSALTWRIVAQSDNLSDGEENTIPILSNRILLTETTPFTLTPKTSVVTNFQYLNGLDTFGVTVQPFSWSAQIVTNPIWNAVTALRYAKTYPHECTEQLFSRFYSNALAHKILKENPTIQAFLSRKQAVNKENKAETASILQSLQEESPWLFASEGFDVSRLSQLFDTTFMATEQAQALEKLLTRTSSNGGLSWYPDGSPDRFITQHIVAGFGHLNRLGLSFEQKNDISSLLTKAVGYLDNQITAFYTPDSTIQKRDMSLLIHAVYARSFYAKMPISVALQKAIDTTTIWLKHHWLGLGRCEKTIAALILHRFGDKNTPKLMVAFIKSEKEPTFWTRRNYYYWNEMPVETKALMIEMYDEITQDTPSVNRLKQELLNTLEDGHWYSTKATTEAVYVLLHCGQPQGKVKNEVVQIQTASPILQQQIIEEQKKENFIHLNLKGKDITKTLNGTTFTNNGEWILNGNVTFKYFENIDKIKSFSNDTLNVLTKHFFKINNTQNGEKLDSLTAATPLSIGDKLRVRLKIHIDKPLEYTHLKDARPSNCEPVDVLSERTGYPLSYYKTTRDVSTNFFFDYLQQGDYELTYDMTVQQRGLCAKGVASLECMYAPNVALHTEGGILKIE